MSERHVIPYDFGEARDAIRLASSSQKSAEQAIRDSYREHGEAERVYRKALARQITLLRSEGIPVTIVSDLARGDKHVADLRYMRDVKDGVREAALSAMWRHSADRRALEQLVDWSKKLEP